jgi:hypothetical protein
MKMIGHQTIRLHLPTGFETSLPQRGQETLAVSVILENRFAPIPAIHDVINRPGILNS